MKRKKKLLVIFCPIAAVLLALGIFLIVWYCGASYPRFEALARAEFEIPGLPEGVCPQGLCALPENGSGYDFAMSGYLSGGASRVYLIDEEGKAETKYVTVLENGVEDASHFGGVACSDKYLYVASGERVARLSLAEAAAAQNGGGVEAEYFAAGLNAAFCQYDGGLLYVGEFYRPGNYETPESHHLPTSDGGTNPALVYAYEIDGEGVPAQTPMFALSVRELVQGFAVYEGGIALSCSYGLADSGIWVYENVLNTETDKTFDVGGVAVPLYVLDGSVLRGTLAAPCMSEEIAVRGGRLYILFESKANKYKLFTRVRMSHVQSVALADLASF